MSNDDVYQERYIKHQERKKKVLLEIMKARHSDRMFGDGVLPDYVIKELVSVVELCPSSCDRKAVGVRVIDSRDDKAILSGLLVGGVGWIHRASHILLLFADQDAYKAPGEVDYMPQLDAGVVVEQLYLMATAQGLACVYVNPNVRESHKKFFTETFGDRIFCGAFAVGNKYE